jgi:nitrogen regulatory protein PII
MEKIGITGMTVTQVLGYGMQPSKTYYRGASVEAS